MITNIVLNAQINKPIKRLNVLKAHGKEIMKKLTKNVLNAFRKKQPKKKADNVFKCLRKKTMKRLTMF